MVVRMLVAELGANVLEEKGFWSTTAAVYSEIFGILLRFPISPGDLKPL